MKFRVLILLTCVFWAGFSHATVLNFDSIVGSDCSSPVWGASVDGFTLEGATAGVFDDTNCGFINSDGAFSPPNMMVNFNSEIGTISKDVGTFDFNGAYFHADDRDGSTMVDFAGYDLSDTLIFSKTEEITTDWQWVSFEWAGISKFTWDPVSPNSTSNVSIDDFTYDGLPTVEPSVPVPTMSQWALVTLSMLIGLMVFVNRRRLF